MFDIILGYALIVLGGILFGIGIAIYCTHKHKVMRDLFALILYFVVAALFVFSGIMAIEG